MYYIWMEQWACELGKLCTIHQNKLLLCILPIYLANFSLSNTLYLANGVLVPYKYFHASGLLWSHCARLVSLILMRFLCTTQMMH